MDQETWMQEMHDYADVHLNLKHWQLAKMFDVAIIVKPWEKDADPIDWSDEWFRNQHSEDR
jgi:hypothetical protein